jgi:hypothetical protein
LARWGVVASLDSFLNQVQIDRWDPTQPVALGVIAVDKRNQLVKDRLSTGGLCLESLETPQGVPVCASAGESRELFLRLLQFLGRDTGQVPRIGALSNSVTGGVPGLKEHFKFSPRSKVLDAQVINEANIPLTFKNRRVFTAVDRDLPTWPEPHGPGYWRRRFKRTRTDNTIGGASGLVWVQPGFLGYGQVVRFKVSVNVSLNDGTKHMVRGDAELQQLLQEDNLSLLHGLTDSIDLALR